jgi:NadR type nicotinamide-nucleotide adenylyltransferase
MEKSTNRIIRVALIGPESTAKSTLSEALATQFETVWVRERSREYLSQLGRNYTQADVEAIASEQLAEERELIKHANRLLFADTEIIIAIVWCQDVFGNTPAWMISELQNKYDLYLLTAPDLPWVPDPLRENPHRREFFFDWYKSELEKIGANYVVIEGEGQERLSAAIRAVENFLQSNK